jgi:hypothetical protein
MLRYKHIVLLGFRNMKLMFPYFWNMTPGHLVFFFLDISREHFDP